MKLSFHLLTRAVTFAGLLLLADGCERSAPVAAPSKPSAEAKAAAEQRLLSKLNLVFSASDMALTEGRTNEAISAIADAFSNRTFAAWRPQILDSLLRTMLRCSRTDEARQQALAVSTDPALSAGSCEMLYRYYHDLGNMTNALAWSAEIAERHGVPHSVRMQAFTWNIADLVALHNDDQALAMLGKSFTTLKKPADGMSLVHFTIEALLNAGRPESIERVLALASTLKCSPAEIKYLGIVTHARIFAACGDWTSLTNNLPIAISTLPDGELDGLLHAVMPVVAKSGKPALLDQFVELVLFNPAATAKPSALSTAARKWGEMAMESDKTAFPGRLATLLRVKVPADTIAELYTRFYYAFSEQPAPLKELIAFGEKLAPLIKDEDARNDIKIKVLDGCFLVQDYDRALAMLASRIPGPGRTEQWHATAIVKIKAHRALQHNEPREAVKYFREFMNQLRDSKESEISDPVTGLFFPKEMVLGRNAKRIGDILAGIPDPAEAAKAYAEARDLYQQSLKNTTDAEALKVIGAEIAQLPRNDGK